MLTEVREAARKTDGTKGEWFYREGYCTEDGPQEEEERRRRLKSLFCLRLFGTLH